jgi:nitrite reductase/ring-hydroxylating ferredoxin subunit
LGDVDEIRDDDMGIVWGHSITCPLHNWVFNLEDGTCDKYPPPLLILH